MDEPSGDTEEEVCFELTVLDGEAPLPWLAPGELVLIDDDPKPRIKWKERTPRELAEVLTHPQLLEGRAVELEPVRVAPAGTRPGRLRRLRPMVVGTAIAFLVAGVWIGLHLSAWLSGADRLIGGLDGALGKGGGADRAIVAPAREREPLPARDLRPRGVRARGSSARKGCIPFHGGIGGCLSR